MRHLAIVGHSAEGAALCFVTFCHESGRYLGPDHHPDVTLDCIAFGPSMPAWEAGDHASIRATFATSVSRLAAAGAEFFVCPDNTAHLALEHPGDDLDLPGVHIADAVADRAAACGHGRVGLLGTRYLVEGPVYPRALAARGIEAIVPTPDERATVNGIIFDELVRGSFTDASRAEMIGLIERLAARGCDAVALVCTELPILVPESASPLPTLDSTRLLAKAAAAVAVGERPLPTWRGGRV